MHIKSESIAALSGALAAAQAEIENAHKTANNPHFRSKYADLAEVINTTRPVLSAHGLSVSQWPSFADGMVSVETLLTHKSGEWIANTASAPADKLTAQGVGSAITYLRRYSLAALACIAQEDDDGNQASKKPAKAREPAVDPAPTNGRKSAAQAKRDGDNETVRSMIEQCETIEDLQARWKMIEDEWLPILPASWSDHISDFYQNKYDTLREREAA